MSRSISPELADLSNRLSLVTIACEEAAEKRLRFKNKLDRDTKVLAQLDQEFAEYRHQVEALTADVVARVALEARSH